MPIPKKPASAMSSQSLRGKCVPSWSSWRSSSRATSFGHLSSTQSWIALRKSFSSSLNLKSTSSLLGANQTNA